MSKDISEFYENREIFITGGSGFVGKVVIEKIFRSFNVKRFYMLLRTKKEISLDQRLENFKKDCIFDRLKKEKPNELSKLVMIPGDISELGLTLSAESIELMKNVSVIFHSAATVRFDEPLQKAVFLNVRGTHEVLKFAEGLKLLDSFVHVSTLFCNPHLDFVDEKVYPSPVDWKTCIKMSETMPENLIAPVTEKYILPFPNTYTFTKNLAEQVVFDYQHKVPVTIIRPSIVVSTLIEPEPSYLSSKAGTMGFLAIAGTGLIRTVYGDPITQVDQIPVDVVARASILLAWQRGINNLSYVKNLPYVMHCSGEGYSKMKLSDMVEHAKQSFKKYPHEMSVWYPSVAVTDCWYYYFFRTILIQILPSVIIDGILRFKGHPPFVMKLQRFVFGSLSLLTFFMSRTYCVSNTNSEYIYQRANDMPDFTVDSYRMLAKSENVIVDIVTLATRRHLLKYKDSTIEKSKKLYKILFYVDKISHIILYYFVAKLAIFYLILPTFKKYI